MDVRGTREEGVVIIGSNRFPTATCLLAVWSRPWSSSAKRWAAHRLAQVFHLGFDVLEMPGRWPNTEQVLDAFERPWTGKAE